MSSVHSVALAVLALVLVGCGSKSNEASDTGSPTTAGPTGGATPSDQDGDGYLTADDCDDTNAAVNPGEDELAYDGLDNDCDPATPDDDMDGDGFLLAEDCDDGDASVNPDATELDGDSIDNDCDPATCVLAGFDSVGTPWALPPYPSLAGYAGMGGFIAGSANCSNGAPEYWPMDIDGDGFEDFVVVESPCDDGVTGYTEWKVYLGSASGFAQTATPWILPPYPALDNYPIMGEIGEATAICDDGRPEYGLLEMDGDGFLDFVVFESPCDDGVTGYTEWKVYSGSASGFAQVATSWSLPPYPSLGSGPSMGGLQELIPDCGDGVPEYTVRDMDGDGFVDFVVVETPCNDGVTGYTEWQVYLGSASGFAQSATSWALPPYPSTGFFSAMGAFSWPQTDCFSGVPAYAPRDLDGDGYEDFVVTESPCDDGVIGYTEWKVYLGSASGFAQTPSSWTLPPYPSLGGYPSMGDIVESSPVCTDGVPEFNILNMDDDRFQDFLVVESPCDDGMTGYTEWKVYQGGPSGFAQTPLSWTLPSYPSLGGSPNMGELLGASTNCTDGAPEYSVLDINGNGVQDFVVVESPCDDGVTGYSEWTVYLDSCAQ